jgi:hypothetical protein
MLRIFAGEVSYALLCGFTYSFAANSRTTGRNCDFERAARLTAALARAGNLEPVFARNSQTAACFLERNQNPRNRRLIAVLRKLHQRS